LALDPSGAATCTGNAALIVTVTGVNPVATWAVDATLLPLRYRLITVSVAVGTTQLAELNAVIANY
jgi:hypothetical protein